MIEVVYMHIWHKLIDPSEILKNLDDESQDDVAVYQGNLLYACELLVQRGSAPYCRNVLVDILFYILYWHKF